jgi:lysophospholipase L1-like esterase
MKYFANLLAVSLALGCAEMAMSQTSVPTRTLLADAGNYSVGTAYNVDDVVSLGGALYLSLVANNVGNVPGSSPAQWIPIGASSGVSGGIVGIPGPMGPPGPPGPPGATGPAGPASATGGLSASAVASESTALLLSQEPTVVNLFDKSRITDGYGILWANGKLAPVSGNFTSDFMLVAGASYVTVSTAPFEGNSAFGYAFYDSSQNYVSGGQANGGNYTGSPQMIAVPAAAVYFRTSGNDDQLNTFMAVRGTALPSSYVAFAQPPFVLTSAGVQAVLTPAMVSPLNGQNLGVWGDSISSIFVPGWQPVVIARTGATLQFQDARPGRGFINFFECYGALAPGSALGVYNPAGAGPNSCGVFGDKGAALGNTLAQNIAGVNMMIVQGGTNDQGSPIGALGDPTNAGTVHGSLRWVFETLMTANPTMHIVLVGPQANSEGTLAQTQAVVTAEAQECNLYGVPFLNMLAVGGGNVFNNSFYTRDGTHPSDYTFAHFYGPIMAQFIQQYY